ncbi:MAG: HPP family protein [Planctomycetes bacterium]|nr:HPP family protein [Planctomycetota bacterium]
MHFPNVSTPRAARVALWTTLAALVVGALAWRTGLPLLFPALGASTFIVFALPSAPAAAPRNVILAHAAGALIGWACLWACAVDASAAGPSHLHGMPHVLAASLSLGLTTLAMLVLRAPHPPAGATTLIVSLGSMPELWHVGVVVLACVMLVLLAQAAHQAAGVPYPWWRPRPSAAPGAEASRS